MNEFIDTIIAEVKEIETAMIPRTGLQVLSNTFVVKDNHYKGRLEEIKRFWSHHPEIYLNHSFEEYVEMTCVAIEKPAKAVKQELIDMVKDYLTAKELTKFVCLINKL